LLLFLMWIGVSHAAEEPGPKPPPAAQELASLCALAPSQNDAVNCTP
jgi:hypothetical protein